MSVGSITTSRAGDALAFNRLFQVLAAPNANSENERISMQIKLRVRFTCLFQ
jgi:hypothetical protein